MVIVGCMDYMDEVTLDVDWLRNQLLERDWVKVDNAVSPTIELWVPSEKSPIVFDQWRDDACVRLSLNRDASACAFCVFCGDVWDVGGAFTYCLVTIL